MRKFNVNVNGKTYAVEVEEIVDGSTVVPVVTKAAPAPQAKAPVQAAPANGTAVKAPMPGLVKKLCFASGTQIKKGDTIIILEAMKMDTPVVAPENGVISYSTQEGANVDTGAVIATIA